MKNQRRVSETDYHNEQLYALANIQARYLHVSECRILFCRRALAITSLRSFSLQAKLRQAVKRKKQNKFETKKI